MKEPLACELPVYTNSETALAQFFVEVVLGLASVEEGLVDFDVFVEHGASGGEV